MLPTAIGEWLRKPVGLHSFRRTDEMFECDAARFGPVCAGSEISFRSRFQRGEPRHCRAFSASDIATSLDLDLLGPALRMHRARAMQHGRIALRSYASTLRRERENP
ncbi:MAG: hypothetical protein AMXMBFR61_15150 [Fimbriimonadales bacterium]